MCFVLFIVHQTLLYVSGTTLAFTFYIYSSTHNVLTIQTRLDAWSANIKPSQ